MHMEGQHRQRDAEDQKADRDRGHDRQQRHDHGGRCFIEHLKIGIWGNTVSVCGHFSDLGLSAHQAKMPPSTAMACPTMKLAPELHSHRTAAAISSGLPRRPIGSAAMKALMMSGSLFFVTRA